MTRPIIHLLNPMTNPAGGSEWRTLSLYDLLRPHTNVTIWALQRPSTDFPPNYPITQIATKRGRFPSGGTFVFVGYYRVPGDWINQSRSDRTILICNTPNFSALPKTLVALSALRSPIEIVYAANWMQNVIKVPGSVQISPINVERFHPRTLVSRSPDDAFTVGRMSRDVIAKHHPEDMELYRTLSRLGHKIRVMGGTVLNEQSQGLCGLELLPCRTEPAEDFLRSLHCFYYRTHPTWIEPFGRVVMEAMACGLPVVAHRAGGYSEWITHGTNGYLFDTTTEALDLIHGLSRDPDLRQRVGHAARRTVEEMLDPDQLQKTINYYLPSRVPELASDVLGDSIRCGDVLGRKLAHPR